MKGLAFVYDPDGYWVELVKRGDNHGIKREMNFSQTMLRVKDPKKSIEFYQRLGMKVLVERHFDDFSLFFLGSSVVPDGASPKDMFDPCLELTHNHGTEKDDEFRHFNGNEEGRQGFGHIGFLVDDVYKACDAIREMGYGFRKVGAGSDLQHSAQKICLNELSCYYPQEPDGGTMKGLAFAYDPDGYSVEIIPRGGIEFGDVKVTK